MAGRLPYEAASLTDLARQQATPPPRLDDLVPDVPATLAAAVQRALAGDPEQRYRDAGAMEKALQQGLDGRGPTASPRPRGSRRRPHRVDAGALAHERDVGAAAAPRRLEPIDEPHAGPRPGARAARRAARSRSAPPPREVARGGGPGKWVALLVVIALDRRRRRRLPGGRRRQAGRPAARAGAGEGQRRDRQPARPDRRQHAVWRRCAGTANGGRVGTGPGGQAGNVGSATSGVDVRAVNVGVAPSGDRR